ncbi:MAG TPA: PAS domain-containing protein [Longimicrobium sp.]|jgi:photoactive yellow protein|uniref:PAS domain-containing protein n=1 Tax=Longimicrobium sp. TaxID=2029185 RepID=UPI002EDAD517
MQATLNAPNNVLERADVLTEAELDGLPVGMIQLDRSGTVLKFNQTESSLARMDKSEALGRSFFDEVAPCTKVQEFYGKFVEGVENRNLHTVFPYQFRFRDGRQKNVVISMFYSGSTETVWVLVQRPDA